MSKLGFIGLGIMGAPMAGHLLAGGHELHVHSRSGAPQALLDAGATAQDSAADVARAADVVFLMLPDTPDVEKVLFGAGGIVEGLTPGKTVVDMSSISPIETKAFAERIRALGCDYLDAPVSGGEVGAKGITEQELNDAKTYLTGSYPLSFTNNGAIAGMVLQVQRDRLGIDYLNKRNDLINAVTLDDVARVARRLLRPDALTTVVVGQPEGVKITRTATVE